MKDRAASQRHLLTATVALKRFYSAMPNLAVTGVLTSWTDKAVRPTSLLKNGFTLDFGAIVFQKLIQA
ncbi:MAG: hypothetical protein BA871_02590 [Desulfuromonadales bacterium C00003096]|nr:MAG: hypothetical protein BA871_02590 [Desulfuromonadales bacterium C00003096]